MNREIRMSILVDNPDSRVVPYAEEIVIVLTKKNNADKRKKCTEC